MSTETLERTTLLDTIDTAIAHDVTIDAWWLHL